jgi:hypothetical protein
MTEWVRNNWKLIAIAGWIFFSFHIAMSNAVDIPTNHVDGTFQTASGLYRLSLGFFPGKDFYPYLGLGPLLVLYPLFWLAGSHISASLFASYFITSLAGSLSFAVVWHLISRARSGRDSLLVGFFVYNSFVIFSLLTGMDFGWASMSPGNSLRPIRASIPYLIVLFLWHPFKNPGRKVGYVFAGFAGGLALIWSNDFAFPTAGMMILLMAGLSWYRKSVSNFLIFVLVMILSWFLLFVTVTDFHGLALLKYNFRDVAPDQWWVFGPYEEMLRVFTPLDLNRLLLETFVFDALLILSFFYYRALKTRELGYVLLAAIGSILFAGGAVASVGGHIGGYFTAFIQWAKISLLFEVVLVGWRLAPGTFRKRLDIWVKVSVLVLSSAAIAGSVYLDHRRHDRASRDAQRIYVAELGGYLPADWTEYVETARKTPDHVLEEYWGIWSAIRRVVPDWPVDAVIHALGSTRELAASRIQDAEVIITTRAGFTHWQGWNVAVNYWFYESILDSWTIVGKSPNTLIWRRQPRPILVADIPVNFDTASKTLQLEVPRPGFYELTLDYHASAPNRFLLLVRDNFTATSCLPHFYTTINPHGSHVKFLTYFTQAGPGFVDFHVIGTQSARVEVSRCKARAISYLDPEVLKVGDTLAFHP